MDKNKRYIPEGRVKTNPQKKRKPETTKTAKNPYASSTIIIPLLAIIGHSRWNRDKRAQTSFRPHYQRDL